MKKDDINKVLKILNDADASTKELKWAGRKIGTLFVSVIDKGLENADKNFCDLVSKMKQKENTKNEDNKIQSNLH